MKKEVKIETGTGMQICRYGKMQVLVGPATKEIKDGLKAAGARPLRGLFPEKFQPSIPGDWLEKIGYTNRDGIVKVFAWRIDAAKTNRSTINYLLQEYTDGMISLKDVVTLEWKPPKAILEKKKRPGRPQKSASNDTKKVTPEGDALIQAISIARKYKSWDQIPAKELAEIAALCDQAGINIRVIRAAI